MTPAGSTHPESAVVGTALALPGRREGKVRDIYELPSPADQPPRLLIVATDRLSAFDVVLPTPLPGKGRILTDMAVFWLRFAAQRGLCRSHLLSTSVDQVPEAALAGLPRSALAGRIMIARRCRVIPVECVVRGYLEGSGWKDYRATGSVCGVRLPAGLAQCARLPEPIFTPATKEDVGAHDQNISYDAAIAHLERSGWNAAPALMDRLRSISLAIYKSASDHAAARGILIADTKFEFGIPVNTGTGLATPDPAPGEDPILIDEALTPDSSRFWPADQYQPGRAQRSYDKQFVREYLEGLVAAGKWDKTAPGPEIPPQVVEKTLARYREARDRLTGPLA